MNASDYAAWYAAIVATLIAILNFVKWKMSGPSISGEAKANWKTSGIPVTEGKVVAIASLTNRGDTPATLTSWGLYWYPAKGSLCRKNRKAAFVIMGGAGGYGVIPCKLSPGDTWKGITEQNAEMDKMLSEGRLFFAFGFSHTNKEVIMQLDKSQQRHP